MFFAFSNAKRSIKVPYPFFHSEKRIPYIINSALSYNQDLRLLARFFGENFFLASCLESKYTSIKD